MTKKITQKKHRETSAKYNDIIIGKNKQRNRKMWIFIKAKPHKQIAPLKNKSLPHVRRQYDNFFFFVVI